MFEIMSEYVIALLTLGVMIIGFYVRRLYEAIDRNERNINSLGERNQAELKIVEAALIEHRVTNAATFVSRQELDTRFHDLRDDIRGMVKPLRDELHSIGNFLREHNKK